MKKKDRNTIQRRGGRENGEVAWSDRADRADIPDIWDKSDPVTPLPRCHEEPHPIPLVTPLPRCHAEPPRRSGAANGRQITPAMEITSWVRLVF